MFDVVDQLQARAQYAEVCHVCETLVTMSDVSLDGVAFFLPCLIRDLGGHGMPHLGAWSVAPWHHGWHTVPWGSWPAPHRANHVVTRWAQRKTRDGTLQLALAALSAKCDRQPQKHARDGTLCRVTLSAAVLEGARTARIVLPLCTCRG